MTHSLRPFFSILMGYPSFWLIGTYSFSQFYLNKMWSIFTVISISEFSASAGMDMLISSIVSEVTAIGSLCVLLRYPVGSLRLVYSRALKSVLICNSTALKFQWLACLLCPWLVALVYNVSLIFSSLCRIVVSHFFFIQPFPLSLLGLLSISNYWP